MDTRSGLSAPFRTLAQFIEWCSRAPAGTHLLASAVAELLSNCRPEIPHEKEQAARPPRIQSEPWTWRERLWTVPAETRLGVVEAAEALGRPKSYIYARTMSKAKDPLPHRKLDGSLVFTVGELRTWIRNQEQAIVGLPMESTAIERRIRPERGHDPHPG